MGEKHHHHTLRGLFKRDTSGSSSSSTASLPDSSQHHTGISRLFHHDKSADISPTESNKLSRSLSFSSVKKNKNEEFKPKQLSKAETLAHIQHVNQKNAIRANNANTTARSPSNQAGGHQEKIKYNPFGLNKNPSSEAPKKTSFYMSGTTEGGGRVLANPVADPNDYLPSDMKQEHINLLDDFEIEASSKVGCGGSADVMMIHINHHKKQVFALKKLVVFDKESDEEFYKRTSKEFIISKKCGRSRHVIDSLELVRIQSSSHFTRSWGFVLEYCPGGDLFNLIVKPGWKRTPLAEKYCIFKQVAYGLKFMHDLGICHRDLKPENILLDSKGIAKICDFGVSDYAHETPDDLTSPIKFSHSYVGSPPYSPPEVMKLKELSRSEAQKWPYDPYKMDCWSLGMLLFCVVYGGVPFAVASPSDHGYRDYKFNHDRFCSSHPTFKSNSDAGKGPGSEFKWASNFQSTGASRVAWKLCDPSVKNRFDLNTLFEDPWFVGLEMCIYEDPDQDVNPFVLATCGGTEGSGYSSSTTSRHVSRKNTIISHDHEVIHTPIRSMLDTSGGDFDNISMNSASSLNHATHSGTPKKQVQSTNSFDSKKSTESLVPKVKSMLDLADDSSKKSSSNPALEVVQEKPSLSLETEIDEEPECNSTSNENVQQTKNSEDQLHQSPSDLTHCNLQSDDMEPPPKPAPENMDAASIAPSITNIPLFLQPKKLKSATDLTFDSNGNCDLGYKIRRHHHLELGAAVSGTLSRKNGR